MAPKRRWQCRINRKPIVYFHVDFINIPTIDTIAQVWSCAFTLRGWTSGLKGARTCVHRFLERVVHPLSRCRHAFGWVPAPLRLPPL